MTIFSLCHCTFGRCVLFWVKFVRLGFKLFFIIMTTLCSHMNDPQLCLRTSADNSDIQEIRNTVFYLLCFRITSGRTNYFDLYFYSQVSCYAINKSEWLVEYEIQNALQLYVGEMLVMLKNKNNNFVFENPRSTHVH